MKLIFCIICISYTVLLSKEQKIKPTHNIFKNSNNKDRLSISPNEVPSKKNQVKQQLSTEEQIAMRIVERYRQIFNYLDNDPVDNYISAKELSIAFDEFNWPKNEPNEFDNLAYSKKIIHQFSNGKKLLSFVEFCQFLEELWNDANKLENEECQQDVQKAKDTFDNLFEWLDRDRDGLVSKEDMIYGISRVMLRDVDVLEIEAIIKKYDETNKGKITKESFIKSAMNGMLENSLNNEDD